MLHHRHILITEPGQARHYTSTQRGGGQFATPPRDRRVHAQKLLRDLRQAEHDAMAVAAATGHIIHDLCLEVIGEQGHGLKTESLESYGTEVLTAHSRGGRLHVTVRVPEGKLRNFVRKIERYESENNARSGRPKNEDLVAGISGIRFPVLRSFWTDDDDLFPQSETENIWWEVWIRVGPTENPDDVFAAFVAVVAESQLQLGRNTVRFPERLVFLAHGSAREWMRAFVPLLDRLAEFRRAKELPTEYLRLSAREQREFVDALAARIVPPAANAPAVCLLDYGVHADHPLLRPLLRSEDVQAFEPTWTAVDATESHGTEMAGLIGFGDALPDLLSGGASVPIGHRIESVRMLRSGHAHAEDTWGSVTQRSLSMAEIQAPNRQRLTCLPVTADDRGRDRGRPTEWSGAIDQHASGYLDAHRRLYVVAAGNVREITGGGEFAYPESNQADHRIEDPAQSWNALTVGAFTDRIDIRSVDFDGYQPVAPRGGLCPSSRTSVSWDDDTWPLKPDIVLEGGNYARSAAGHVDGCGDLSLLTTTLDRTGRLLTWTSDTSAATAQAARLGAILMADYPELWPETIRGLLVHSAAWTDEMLRQVPGTLEADRHRRLRCFGYGVPDLELARHTVENNVSLVHQGSIQPFRLDGTDTKTNHFMLHSLPWPKAVLRQLHDQLATVRITLSYFIEPSPAGRGWGKKFRYASHGLRFALRGPTENEVTFRRRVSSQEWEEEEERPPTGDPIGWVIGSRLRTRGSIHSDWWIAPAAEVAECGQVAVFPVTGWWRERKHLGFVEKRTRYALLITISTPATNVDLYTPIAQQVGLVTQITS